MLSDADTVPNKIEAIGSHIIPCPDTFIDDEPLNILLVEDVATDALFTRFALDETKIPYALSTLRKGSEVLPYLAKHNKAQQQKETVKLPDLIMLDLGLPGISGFEILESLTTAHALIRAVPIIILSGYEHFEYLRKAENLYIPAYITKPCHPQKLRDVITRVCRKKMPAATPASDTAY